MNYDFVINESGTMIPCYTLYNSEVDVDGIVTGKQIGRAHV